MTAAGVRGCPHHPLGCTARCAHRVVPPPSRQEWERAEALDFARGLLNGLGITFLVFGFSGGLVAACLWLGVLR